MASPDFKDFATAFFLIAANGRTGAEGSDSLSLLLSDHLPRLPLRMLPSSGGGGAMGPLPSGRRRRGDATAAAAAAAAPGLDPPLLLLLLPPPAAAAVTVVIVVVGAVYLAQLPVPRPTPRAAAAAAAGAALLVSLPLAAADAAAILVRAAARLFLPQHGALVHSISFPRSPAALTLTSPRIAVPPLYALSSTPLFVFVRLRRRRAARRNEEDIAHCPAAVAAAAAGTAAHNGERTSLD